MAEYCSRHAWHDIASEVYLMHTISHTQYRDVHTVYIRRKIAVHGVHILEIHMHMYDIIPHTS